MWGIFPSKWGIRQWAPLLPSLGPKAAHDLPRPPGKEIWTLIIGVKKLSGS